MTLAHLTWTDDWQPLHNFSLTKEETSGWTHVLLQTRIGWTTAMLRASDSGSAMASSHERFRNPDCTRWRGCCVFGGNHAVSSTGSCYSTAWLLQQMSTLLCTNRKVAASYGGSRRREREDLIPTRQRTTTQCEKKKRFQSCWSWDGGWCLIHRTSPSSHLLFTTYHA